ncbi:T9SS type A sorting domain-containing protein [Ferruginibacter sp.]
MIRPLLNLIYLLFFCCAASMAQHTHFESGDIFLGQGSGIIQWRDAHGVLIKNINTGDAGNGNGTGLRIHPLTGQLWVTNSNLTPGSPNGIRIINTDGTVAGTIDISAYQGTPTSITFDSKGNAYVGDLWSPVIVKINPAGTAITDHFTISSDGFVYGPEWVEMDCNDSIIYYTNLKERVKRYNVATRQQLPNYAEVPNTPNWLFGMRLLPDSGMVVASADNKLFRLNKAGAIVRSYAPANLCGFFGIAATPDGKSFWAGGLAGYGPMYKFDIASGMVVDSFLAAPTLQGINIHGIAIYGDKQKNCAAVIVPPPAESATKLMQVYPNPGKGVFTLQTTIRGVVTVKLVNNLGQPVFSKQYETAANSNTLPLNLQGITPGIYLLQVTGNGEVYTQKIVIK